MDGRAPPALQPLKRPLDLPELPGAAKLPNLGRPAGPAWPAPGACAPGLVGGLPGAPGAPLAAAGRGAAALAFGPGPRPGALVGGAPAPPPAAGPPGQAAAAAAGLAGGLQSAGLEIPNDKVQLVLGAQGATIKAIKAISGASCYMQQAVQPSEKSVLTMSGTPAQIEKCRGLVVALVEGAGVPMSAGVANLEPAGAGGVSALPSLPGLPGVAGLSSLPRPPGLSQTVASLPGAANGHVATAGLKAGPSTTAVTGNTVPSASPANLAALVGSGGSIDPGKLAGIAGASGNSLGSLSNILTGVLNSNTGASPGLYTQLLTAATQLVSSQAESSSEVDVSRKQKPQAFDREALKRLAQQAQENQQAEAAGGASASASAPPVPPAAAQAGRAPAGAAPAAPQAPEPPPPPGPEPAPWAAPPAPAPAEPRPGNKKDSSSVLGILQQAQDNAARGRVGIARGASTSAPPRSEGGAASSSTAVHAGGAGVAGLLEALGARLASASSSPEARRAVEKEVLAMIQKLEPRRITELVLRVYDAGTLRSEELLDDVTRAVYPLIPRFGSPDLTRLTATLEKWALETMDGGDEGKLRLSEGLRAYFNGVSNEVSLRLMDVAPGDLARIAASLASLGLGGARLFASIARAAVARSDRFAPAELVSLVLAFDKARFFQTALFEALARCLRTNIKDVAPKDVIQGMRLLAMCGIQDKELGQAIGEHMPKKASSGGLSAEDFCMLAWTFCALDLHHDRLFRAVFQALEDAAVVAGETLCQLYEIHLTLKAFHQESYREYELEDDTVQSLREHYRRQRGGAARAVKLERSAERVHADVAEQLRDVIEASVSTAHQTSLGFTVDVAATRRKSSQSSALVFVEIDGPHSLVRSLDPMDAVGVGHPSRVRGAAALKRRVLHKHGFRLGVVNEDEWRTMSKSKEKRDFLRDLLVKAGVSDDRLL